MIPAISIPQVLVIQLGSQYTDVIAKTLRELGVRSVVLSPEKSKVWLEEHNPRAIILSGGEASVNDVGAPVPPEEVLHSGVKVLGICYGMQWLAKRFGGKVEKVLGKENYGHVNIRPNVTQLLFTSLAPIEEVWASHGDSVTWVPAGFREIGRFSHGGIAAICSESEQFWGVQFHPEVWNTEKGKVILSNFLFHICDLKKDWQPKNIIEEIREEVLQESDGEKIIAGMSGGVDSTTLLAILAPVLGERLQAITIDGGQLRSGELEEIRTNASYARIPLWVIEKDELFLKALSGVTDAEKKRSAFRLVYRDIFIREAEKFGVQVVLQGSLAPDFIESGLTGGARIKSHHNTGGFGDMKTIHPFRNLFKDEVRELARLAGLPKSVSERHPFPGPGLFCRILWGEVTRGRLEILKWADKVVRDILARSGDYEKISKEVIALGCGRVTGVKGDARVYGYSILVRAVVTSDYMTARGYHLKEEVEDEIISAVTKHQDIVTVGFFPVDKPPQTIEFE